MNGLLYWALAFCAYLGVVGILSLLGVSDPWD